MQQSSERKLGSSFTVISPCTTAKTLIITVLDCKLNSHVFLCTPQRRVFILSDDSLFTRLPHDVIVHFCAFIKQQEIYSNLTCVVSSLQRVKHPTCHSLVPTTLHSIQMFYQKEKYELACLLKISICNSLVPN